MMNATFSVIYEVIWVLAMPEFVHQDCVKLIHPVIIIFGGGVFFLIIKIFIVWVFRGEGVAGGGG